MQTRIVDNPQGLHLLYSRRNINMATTTFNGIVRSESGLKVVSKDAQGAFTDQLEVASDGGIDIQKVAATGNNLVAAGTATGANNASLGTAATRLGTITPAAHGSGFPDAAINTFVDKLGGTITTTILIDLHGGASSGGAADDIIGTADAANAYIAEIDHEINGVPMLVEFGCTEVPTGGDPDINLDCSATATDAEDAAVTSGTNLLNNGDLTLGFYATADAGAALAAAKKYIYLTAGAATNAAYTAGKLWIRITGMAVDTSNG